MHTLIAGTSENSVACCDAMLFFWDFLGFRLPTIRNVARAIEWGVKVM